MRIFNILTQAINFGSVRSRNNFFSFLLKALLYIIPAIILGNYTDITVKKVNLETLELEDIQDTFNNMPLDAYLRLHRDKRLTMCDWTVGADSPLSDSKKTEWQTYRQALRDLPSTNTAPQIDDIVWPTKPE